MHVASYPHRNIIILICYHFCENLAQSLEIGMVGDKQKQQLPSYTQAVYRGCVLFTLD